MRESLPRFFGVHPQEPPRPRRALWPPDARAPDIVAHLLRQGALDRITRTTRAQIRRQR